MRARQGMALAVTIGVVSLIAILAVATLSLGGRLVQTSAMGLRDARLDAAVAFALASATDQWRAREIGRLAIGSSQSFNVSPSGISISASMTVTRVAADLFWIVSEAAEGDGLRRENMVLRARAPNVESLLADDSTNVDRLGFLFVDSLAAAAPTQLASGARLTAADGFMHVDGNATLEAGSGKGVLIVDGRLTISGEFIYEGVIIARGGISVVVPGVTITGLVRASGSPAIVGNLSLNLNGAVAQEVLRQSLMPSPVSGRRWAEMY